MQVICRFKNVESAKHVARIAQRHTDAKLTVHYAPVTEQDRERGVGDWAIVTYGVELYDVHRLSKCVDDAVKWALAEELAKVSPDNYLLDNWFCNPVNVDKSYFTHVENSRA